MRRWGFAMAVGAGMAVACGSFGGDDPASPTTDAGAEATTTDPTDADAIIIADAATEDVKPSRDASFTTDDCASLPADTACEVSCGATNCTSCKAIKSDHAALKTGFYRLLGKDGGPLDVYCDMETASGGWTMIARSEQTGIADGFGWFSSTGDVFGVDAPYSLDVGKLAALPTEVLFGARADLRTWGANAYRAAIPGAMLEQNGSTVGFGINVSAAIGTCPGGGYQQNMGFAARTDIFFFRDSALADSIFGLTEHGWVVNTPDDCQNSGGLFNKAGMIFVR